MFEYSSIEESFSKYSDMLYRIAFVMIKNERDAEDIVQDVFVKYLLKSPDFENDAHEKAWLIKVCMNLSRNKMKWYSRHPVVELDEKNAFGHEQGNCFELDLLKSVMELPDKYKASLLLYYAEGYTCKEIARMEHVSESTVKKRLERGRKLLKQSIGKDM